jgi:hypothetical protein
MRVVVIMRVAMVTMMVVVMVIWAVRMIPMMVVMT